LNEAPRVHHAARRRSSLAARGARAAAGDAGAGNQPSPADLSYMMPDFPIALAIGLVIGFILGYGLRVFPIDAVDAQDDERTSSELGPGAGELVGLCHGGKN